MKQGNTTSIALFMKPYECQDSDGFFIPEELIQTIKKRLLNEFSNIAISVSNPFGFRQINIVSSRMRIFYTCAVRPYSSAKEVTPGKQAAILLGEMEIPPEDLVLGSDNVCFLVSEDNFEQEVPVLDAFFKKEGFHCKYGYRNSDRVWINIDTNIKVYGYSQRGMRYPEPIGGHSITVKDFMTIYQIYKKSRK